MRSMAIWYSSNGQGEDLEWVELHFNLWKVPSNRRKFKRFIDIGIMLDRTDSVGHLNIFLPVTLEGMDVTDIVKDFIKDNNLVCAIFNENFKTLAQANSKVYKIHNQAGDFQFNIYQLDNSNLSVEQKFKGTIVKVSCPPLDQKTYFRIRINEKFCHSLVTIQRPSNSFFQSAFSKIELTDFRVNEVRDLNPSLLEQMNQEKQLKISKGHFFYMISSNEDVINYHTPFLSCRHLEKDKWDKYVGNNSIKNNERILAYHWKVKNKTDFNVLIKSKFESNNWLTIAIYILVLFILTFIFNTISTIVYESLKK